MGWLEDQVVLVTGAGSGLGKAVVDRFVREGARVLAFDRSAEKLKALKDEHDDAVEVVTGDVRSVEDNAGAVASALERFGRLDTLIANAGLWDFRRIPAGHAGRAIGPGFDELFGVNVKGYLLGAKAAAPALRESSGSIVLTLSNAALFPGGGGPLYVASKHAGVGLVRQLAYELAPEVRVNAVAPGLMDTDLRGPVALGQADTRIGQAVPIEQVMRSVSALHTVPHVRDYVGPYVLLAAKAQSSTMTGAVIDASSFGIPARPPVAGG